MKSKFKLVCEECGTYVPELYEWEVFYYCEGCLEMTLRQSQDGLENFEVQIDLSDVCSVRRKFDF